MNNLIYCHCTAWGNNALKNSLKISAWGKPGKSIYSSSRSCKHPCTNGIHTEAHCDARQHTEKHCVYLQTFMLINSQMHTRSGPSLLKLVNMFALADAKHQISLLRKSNQVSAVRSQLQRWFALRERILGQTHNTAHNHQGEKKVHYPVFVYHYLWKCSSRRVQREQQREKKKKKKNSCW